jgi:hypothetical protein
MKRFIVPNLKNLSLSRKNHILDSSKYFNFLIPEAKRFQNKEIKFINLITNLDPEGKIIPIFQDEELKQLQEENKKQNSLILKYFGKSILCFSFPHLLEIFLYPQTLSFSSEFELIFLSISGMYVLRGFYHVWKGSEAQQKERFFKTHYKSLNINNISYVYPEHSWKTYLQTEEQNFKKMIENFDNGFIDKYRKYKISKYSILFPIEDIYDKNLI